MTAQLQNKQRAIQTADWITNSQVRVDPFTRHTAVRMVRDYNFGRFTGLYDLDEKKVVEISSNWQAGMSVFALLLMHDYTGDERYLEASRFGGAYIASLQNTIETNKDFLGGINEVIFASRHSCPRDASSAAWGLLRLYRKTREPEYLMRVKLFAQWHMNVAMKKYGYPIWEYHFDHEPQPKHGNWLGSFQSGTALFYYDLYQVTKKTKYKKAMFQILDTYVENFFDKKKGLSILYIPEENFKGLVSQYTSEGAGNAEHDDMHLFNDDFGCLAVMSGYSMTGAKKYRTFITDYLDWCITQQHEDGSFGQSRHSVSSCVAALNLLNAFLLTGNTAYKTSADKALGYLLSFVCLDESDKNVHGGLRGHGTADLPGSNFIGLRGTMYAVYLFALYDLYERFVLPGTTDQIPQPMLDNPMFMGLRCHLSK